MKISLNLKIYIEETVFPKLIGHIKKSTICEKTCQNYMHKWEFKYDEKKGVYYNRHEQLDVMIYRKEWLKSIVWILEIYENFIGDV